MAEEESYQSDSKEDKALDPSESSKDTSKIKATTHLSLSKQKPSLPPELMSNHNSANQYRQQVRKIAQPKYLFAVGLLVLCLGFGFLGGWLGSSNQQNSNNNQSVFNSKQTVVSSQSQAISAVAQSVSPSVVSITATQTATTLTTTLFGFNTSPSSSEDAGTGIILSANGLIVTNHHVIPDGTTSVSVTLSDGTTYNNVDVVGTTSDSSSLDIAFLKITNLGSRKLVPAVIGDSSQMKIGSAVVAIGNALGQFQNTVTSGIISGYGRSIQAADSTGSTEENLTDLFQTDAAINEGNSGGPLVNLSGQVIGINTAIASDSQNIGFAIPINDVTGLIQSVEKTGKLQQPYLGVLYIPITSDIASEYNLSTDQGAWIPPTAVTGQQAVVSGGPAANAGLQAGDIITAIDSQELNQNTSLTSIVDRDQVGQVVDLTVKRGSKTIDVKVTLGAVPADTTTNGGD